MNDQMPEPPSPDPGVARPAAASAAEVAQRWTELTRQANAARDAGRLDEAEKALRAALALEGLDARDVRHGRTLRRLADLALRRGRIDEAAGLAEQALRQLEQAGAPLYPEQLPALARLATCEFRRGKFPEAETLYRQVIAIHEQHEPKSPELARAYINLALALRARGRAAEAEPASRRGASLAEALCGPDHADTLAAILGLGAILADLGQREEAMALARRLASRDRGPPAPLLADLCQRLELWAEGEAVFRRWLAELEQARGPQDPALIPLLRAWAAMHVRQGRDDLALPLYVRHLELMNRHVPADGPGWIDSMRRIIACCERLGERIAVEQYCQWMVAKFSEALGPTHPRVADALEIYLGVARRLYPHTPLLAELLEVRLQSIRALHPAPVAGEPPTR
jgi:tetratricopeptide (TPR) repeat protein